MLTITSLTRQENVFRITELSLLYIWYWVLFLPYFCVFCLSLQALAYIYVQLGQTDKGHEFIRKATKIDPRDAQVKLLI
jgi:hypothetical protein